MVKFSEIIYLEFFFVLYFLWDEFTFSRYKYKVKIKIYYANQVLKNVSCFYFVNSKKTVDADVALLLRLELGAGVS